MNGLLSPSLIQHCGTPHKVDVGVRRCYGGVQTINQEVSCGALPAGLILVPNSCFARALAVLPGYVFASRTLATVERDVFGIYGWENSKVIPNRSVRRETSGINL